VLLCVNHASSRLRKKINCRRCRALMICPAFVADEFSPYAQFER
jgi:hypothetical protein